MNKLRIGIAIAITVVWAVGYILSYVKPHLYRPPDALTPLLGAVVAYLAARETRDVWRNGKDKRQNGF
jgi:hypothetical protein